MRVYDALQNAHAVALVSDVRIHFYQAQHASASDGSLKKFEDVHQYARGSHQSSWHARTTTINYA